MQQHTPGPWRGGKGGFTVVADHPIPEIGGSGDVDYYGGHLVAESVAPQNRPLIAAAPELLGSLKRIVMAEAFQRIAQGATDDADEIAGAIEEAKAAIAKAEGADQ